MRKTIARSILALSIAGAMFGALGGGAAQAATTCQRVGPLGFLCVTAPPDGVEAFQTNDRAFTEVYGAGIECFNGHYYAQYQLGDPDTYRPVPLFDLGTQCPVFS